MGICGKAWPYCVIAGLCLLGVARSASGKTPLRLEPEQQLQLLTEARESFLRAQQLEIKADSTALEEYGNSSQKYRQLVQSGIQNWPILLDAAKACQHAHDWAWACAFFEHVLRQAPDCRPARIGLLDARRELTLEDSSQPTWSQVSYDWNANLPMWMRCWAFLGLWNVGWLLVLSRFIGIWNTPRIVLIGMGLLLLIPTASIAYQYAGAANHPGVVSTDDVMLRSGPSETAETVGQTMAGESYEIVEHRLGWLALRVKDRVAWVSDDSVYYVPATIWPWSYLHYRGSG